MVEIALIGHDNTEKSGQSGFALVAVLGLMLLIAAVLLPFTVSGRLRALTAHNAFVSSRYERVTNALAAHIASNILTNRLNKNNSENIDIKEANCYLGDHYIDIKIQDHAGLIDLNSAGLELLNTGYQSLGFSKEKARSLALATENYRRIDSRKDNEFPQIMSEEAEFKHAAFENIIELQEFSDLQPISHSRLAEVFTTHSRSGTISRNSLSPVIASVLDDRASAMPFVISSSSPRAVTVSLAIFHHDQLQASTKEIYTIAGDDAAYAGSIATSDVDDTGQTHQATGNTCPAIISPSFLVALKEVLR